MKRRGFLGLLTGFTVALVPALRKRAEEAADIDESSLETVEIDILEPGEPGFPPAPLKIEGQTAYLDKDLVLTSASHPDNGLWVEVGS